ncbi:MAG: Zn-ribbon domain-containing OB-fold protein [Desulfobacteraceae bacterium]|nr:Zn-ribbon domain-containing OB-fold protein [Desulfobacteraceae bacterium]
MTGKKIKSIPFREGLFSEESDGVSLIGSKCGACGQIFFPPRAFCFSCFGKEMQTAKLGNRGRLYSFTTSHMPSLHFEAPYTVGWVDMEGGIRLFAPIISNKTEELEPDMEMELVVEELWREEDTRVMGYKFRPLGLAQE